MLHMQEVSMAHGHAQFKEVMNLARDSHIDSDFGAFCGTFLHQADIGNTKQGTDMRAVRVYVCFGLQLGGIRLYVSVLLCVSS